MRWISAVARAASLESMEHVANKWDDFDAELAECVLKIASGQLKRELTFYHEEQVRRGQPISGMASLWHVFRRFRLEKGAAMYRHYDVDRP